MSKSAEKKERIYFNEHVSSLNVYRLTKLNACHSWIFIIVSMAMTIFQFLVSICVSQAEITFVAPAVPEKLQNDY